MKDEENIPKIKSNEIEELIKRMEGYQLPSADKDLITRLLRMWLVVLGLMNKPKTTLDYVKQMLFGKSSKKPSNSDSDKGDKSASTDKTDAESSQAKQSVSQDNETAPTEKVKRGGHGRLPTKAYPGAGRVNCEDPTLKTGEPCLRQDCFGQLYDPVEMHQFIRFESRPFIEGTIYQQKVLRCNSCGTRFSASLPPGIPAEKWDATADVAIAIYRYGAGLPHYRMAKMQQMMGVPVPATTQWERCGAIRFLEMVA